MCRSGGEERPCAHRTWPPARVCAPPSAADGVSTLRDGELTGSSRSEYGRRHGEINAAHEQRSHRPAARGFRRLSLTPFSLRGCALFRRAHSPFVRNLMARSRDHRWTVLRAGPLIFAAWGRVKVRTERRRRVDPVGVVDAALAAFRGHWAHHRGSGRGDLPHIHRTGRPSPTPLVHLPSARPSATGGAAPLGEPADERGRVGDRATDVNESKAIQRGTGTVTQVMRGTNDGTTSRVNLTVRLSTDDGASWPDSALLVPGTAGCSTTAAGASPSRLTLRRAHGRGRRGRRCRPRRGPGGGQDRRHNAGCGRGPPVR